jgi:hypothetical protein
MKKTPAYQHSFVGLAWYQPEQWQRLREISQDRNNLEDTYREWVRNAEKAIRELNRNGIQIVKVTLDVEELLLWCQSQNIPVDDEARSRYVTEKLPGEMQQSGA